MDTILNIFVSLGVEYIIIYQFGILVVFYFILTKLFFSKLQFVIEQREAKTTKREGKANKMFQEADAISEQYKKAIEETQADSFASASKQKAELLEAQRANLKKRATELDAQMEQQRQENKKQVEAQKTVVMGKADELAKELLNKLTK